MLMLTWFIFMKLGIRLSLLHDFRIYAVVLIVMNCEYTKYVINNISVQKLVYSL